jgi:hypothetical protein
MNSCRYHNMPRCAPHCGSSTATILLALVLEMTPFYACQPDRLGVEAHRSCHQFAVASTTIPAERPPLHLGAYQIPIAWHINPTIQTTVAVSFSVLC